MAGTIPEYTIYTVLEKPENWLYYEDTTYIWYIDVIYSGTKYRGFYMAEYRPAINGSLGYTHVNENGYVNHQVYWFKVEPIKWRILTTSGNSAYLMCDVALDCFWLEPNRDHGGYNGENGVFRKDQNGNLDGTYANNWEYCFLRQWLNETFYNEVFNDLQKKIIQTTHLDNSAISSNPNDYPKYYSNSQNAPGENKYAAQCKDTDDKIFLLSLRDITTTKYGFNKEVRAEDPARNLTATDFAKFRGAPMDIYDKTYVTWFTRSPTLGGNSGYATFVLDGHAKGALRSIDLEPDGGVVPALWITL